MCCEVTYLALESVDFFNSPFTSSARRERGRKRGRGERGEGGERKGGRREGREKRGGEGGGEGGERRGRERSIIMLYFEKLSYKYGMLLVGN